MGNGVLDIFAAAVALTLAIVLTCVKMPSGELWQAMRRMNRLLITCYVAMGISNIVTGLLGVSSSADPVSCVNVSSIAFYSHMCNVRISTYNKCGMAYQKRNSNNACRHCHSLRSLSRWQRYGVWALGRHSSIHSRDIILLSPLQDLL